MSETSPPSPQVRVARLDEPLITPNSHPAAGSNINGPSLVRMPDWATGRLGPLHLYFADHKGRTIRLAWAERIEGPWTLHEPGALTLDESRFLTEAPALSDSELQRWSDGYEEALGETVPVDLRDDLVTPHIASPDVHVDETRREIVLYFHGLAAVGTQTTRVAASADGVHFTTRTDEVCPLSYFRAFQRDGHWFGLAMPGRLYRMRPDGTWDAGPDLFVREFRHCAVHVVDDPAEPVDVYWTRAGDSPERILRSRLDCAGPWTTWTACSPTEVLRPRTEAEGADLPVEPSRRGAAATREHQVRDPAIFVDRGRVWLLYSIAGESGIAAAEIIT